MSKISLTSAPVEKRLVIKEINAGMDVKMRLNVMGIHKGDELIKHTWAKWGPILVQNISNSDSKVALGRGLAEKIFVEF